MPPEKNKPFFGPPTPDNLKKPAASGKKSLKKSAPAPTIADKNPLIKTINKQGIKTPFAEETYVTPFNETSKTRYRRSINRKDLEKPTDFNQVAGDPEGWKKEQAFKSDVILIQDMTAFDKKVFGFTTDGDLSNIPAEMWNHPEFMSAWEARAKYRAGLVKNLQSKTEQQKHWAEAQASLTDNAKSGNFAGNLSEEELASANSTNTSEFGGIPFYNLASKIGKVKFGAGELVPKFNDQTGKVEIVKSEGIGFDFGESEQVGNKLASGFAKDPNMGRNKSDPEIILDSILAVTPIIGNPGYTAARLLNPGMSDAETPDAAKSVGLAFDFTTQMVGAFKGHGLFRTGSKVAGAAKAAPTVKGFLTGAGLSAKSALTTSNLLKSGGRFALTDMPGYAKMLSDADGNAEEALKMFTASTFGEFGNLGKLLDSDLPLSQKIQTVTAVAGSLLLGLGALHGVSSGSKAIKNKFFKATDDPAVFAHAAKVLEDAGVSVTLRPDPVSEIAPEIAPVAEPLAEPALAPEAPQIEPSPQETAIPVAADPVVTPAQAPDVEQVVKNAVLPRELKGAKPKYSDADIVFESDIDKAAYIVASDKLKKNKSKRGSDYMNWLIEQGYSEERAVDLGMRVKDKVKEIYNATGSRDGVVNVSRVSDGGAPLQSPDAIATPEQTKKQQAAADIQKVLEKLKKGSGGDGLIGVGFGSIDPFYIKQLNDLADAMLRYGIASAQDFATTAYTHFKEILDEKGVQKASFTRAAKKAYEEAHVKMKATDPDTPEVDMGEPPTPEQAHTDAINDIIDLNELHDSDVYGPPEFVGSSELVPPPIQPNPPEPGGVMIFGRRLDTFFNHLNFLQSQVDPMTGKTIRKGALEAAFREHGRSISDAFFKAGVRGRKYSEEFILDLVDVVDILKQLQDTTAGRKLKKSDWTKIQEDFVNLVEETPQGRQAFFDSLDPNDPQMSIIKQGLDMHDALMEKAKRFIVEGKLFDGSIRIEDPNRPGTMLHPTAVIKDPDLFQQAMDKWGINTRGYYHHSFMGNVGVYTTVVDSYGVTRYEPISVEENNFRTYAEAEKAARDYFDAHPGETIVVKGRDYFSEPEAFKPTEVTRSKLFKMGADLRDNLAQELVDSGLYDFLDNSGQVGVNISDIIKAELDAAITPGTAMEAMRGVVEMARPKKKIHTSFMGRDTSKGDLGRLGYSKDYTAVMGKYLRGIARARNLTEMSFEIAPYVEAIKRDPTMTGAYKHLPGIIEDLWGKQSRSDKWLAKVAVHLGLDQKINDHTQIATAIANYARGLQYLARLKYNPRAWLLNGIQSMMIIPDIGFKAWKEAVKEAGISTSRKDGAWEMLQKEGQLQGAIYGDELDLVKTLSRKTDAHANISEFNRLIGYIAGRNKAIGELPFDVVDANAQQTRVTGLTYDQVMADPNLKAQYDVWKDRIHDTGLQWMARTEGDASTFNKQSWARGPVAGTLTQFKSFTMYQLRDIFQPQLGDTPERYLSRATKKATAMGLVGGFKGVTGVFSIKAMFATAAIMRAVDAIAPDMDDELKDGIANFIYRGIPSLIGLDLSGSVTLFDIFGDSIAEKAYNTIGGPTLGGIAQMADKVMQGKPLFATDGGASVIDGVTPYWRMIMSGIREPEINEGRGKGKKMAWFEKVGAALNLPVLRQSEVYDKRDRKFLRKRVPGADKILKEKRW